MAHFTLDTFTYSAAAAALAGGRDKSDRPIGHNTRLHTLYGSDRIAVRYHATDILTATPDGWVIIDLDGWRSVTTSQRLHALLPRPWGIGSRRGTWSLYASGQPILPFADGIAVNLNTGAVGFSADRGRTPVGVLMTAEDVAAAVAAGRDLEVVRAAKRAALLLRQHPTVRALGTYTGTPHGRGSYNGRRFGCERCDAEQAAERDARRARLAAEHAAMAATLARNPTDAEPWTDAEYTAAGSHVRRETVREYPLAANPKYAGERDYLAGPSSVSEVVRTACPWECPEHRY